MRVGKAGNDRRLLSPLIIGMLAAALITFSPTPARAACTTVVDPVASLRIADTVFVGQVIGLSDLNRTATMNVLETWKGPDLPKQVVVNGSFSGSPQVAINDRTWIMGATYLVVPFGARSPFFDEACSGTMPFVPAGGQIPPQFQDAIGAITARVAAPDPGPAPVDGGGGLANTWLYAAAVGIVMALVLVVRRRRRSRPDLGSPPAARTARPFEPSGSGSGRPPEATESTEEAMAAVAGRKKRRRSKAVAGPSASVNQSRLSRSGLSELEKARKKTRRIKRKRAKSAK